jgi:hypothetical protein
MMIGGEEESDWVGLEACGREWMAEYKQRKNRKGRKYVQEKREKK